MSSWTSISNKHIEKLEEAYGKPRPKTMSTISSLAREAAEKLFQYLENRDWRKEDKLMHLKTFWEHFQGFMDRIQSLKLEGLCSPEHVYRVENNQLRAELTEAKRRIELEARVTDDRCKQVLELERERDSLKAWKESAIKVTPDYQQIGKLLNMRLGDCVNENLIPKIKELIAERGELKSQIAQLKEECKTLSSYDGTVRDRLAKELGEAKGATEACTTLYHNALAERDKLAAIVMDLSAKLDSTKEALSWIARM